MIDGQFRWESEYNGEGALKTGYETDPRWPARCACGYEFKPEDQWQVDTRRLYEGFQDGKLYSLQDPELPIGAMWDASSWMEKWKGSDGLSLVVRLPGGDGWPIDFLSSDGGHWTRTGVPPRITTSPSVNMKGVYHGWIRDGVITEDCEGRKFAGIPRTA